ncbi:NUDIX domain-containing protein [Anaerobacillus alkaliphilus]|uniref:NUDIX domain-containing protein n=1 Tax=Anaerobacillus alkaliphilus TaxID=1548597 RepID=A0A4Q0VRR8_9BACI|nr:NUDIX hydrolase [Anaerobacillus alkaliphilus]RXJ00284.1 NUDIX domain-containing protein [Anaerobacillus alkaliphilus]
MGYIEELRQLVGHRPLIFVGSVVVIFDEKGRVLLQQRRFPNGVWGLPGGLMELGESTEDVAKREVFEETGLRIDNLQLINVYSGPDQFIVAENGDQFYVVTVAYHTNQYQGPLKIDETESIKLEFVYQDQLPEKMVKSHRVILNEFFTK